MYTRQMTNAWLILSSIAMILGFLLMAVLFGAIVSVLVAMFGFPIIPLAVILLAIAMKLAQQAFPKKKSPPTTRSHP